MIYAQVLHVYSTIAVIDKSLNIIFFYILSCLFNPNNWLSTENSFHMEKSVNFQISDFFSTLVLFYMTYI